MKKGFWAVLIALMAMAGMAAADDTDMKLLQDNFVGGSISSGNVDADNYAGIEDFGDSKFPTYDADGSGSGTIMYSGIQQMDRYNVDGAILLYDGDNSLGMRLANADGSVTQATVGSFDGAGPLSYLNDKGTNTMNVDSRDYPASGSTDVAMTETQENTRQISGGTALVDLDNTGNFVARDGDNSWMESNSIGTPADKGIWYLGSTQNNYANSAILSVDTTNHEQVNTQNLIANGQNPANIVASAFTQGSVVYGFLDAGKWDSSTLNGLNQAGASAIGEQSNWELLTDYDGHQGTDTQASDFSVQQMNGGQGNPLGYLGIGQANTFNNDVQSYPGSSWFS
jgi:hypothetical protein